MNKQTEICTVCYEENDIEDLVFIEGSHYCENCLSKLQQDLDYRIDDIGDVFDQGEYHPHEQN
ncbi:hypothetical protein DRQ25_15530 [Candidatus Fermentibacteria bacterium]|nr:MAG: hypothetical protein DRQ25_15530 [Candidatus Fermentibacteria bacterium]